MTTTVTIKTADKAATVHTTTSFNSEDGKVQSYTNTTQTIDPNTELTVSVYGNGNVSVNEYDESEYDW